jgi:hypothetical protein
MPPSRRSTSYNYAITALFGVITKQVEAQVLITKEMLVE